MTLFRIELGATLKVDGFDRQHSPMFVFSRGMNGVPRLGDRFNVRVDLLDGGHATAVAVVDEVVWQEDDDPTCDAAVYGVIVEAWADNDLTLPELAAALGIPKISDERQP